MLKINAAEVYQLKEMVAYQEGSVVSREIIKKETGNVTIFAFGAGQGLSEHSSPFDAIVTVLDGKAQVSIDGKLYELISGEMIVLPANIPHSLHAQEMFKMSLTMIR